MNKRQIDKRLVAAVKQNKQLFDAYVADALDQENERLQAAQDWTAAARVQGRIQMLKQFARDFTEEPNQVG